MIASVNLLSEIGARVRLAVEANARSILLSAGVCSANIKWATVAW
jgi:hypothetical protein